MWLSMQGCVTSQYNKIGRTSYADTIWKGVAEVKKYGYKIDDITSFPISDYKGDTTVNILVVMCK